MNFNTLPLKENRILLRVDFNVPQDKEGNITDDTRIRAVLPTIEALLKKGAKVVIMSHLGRPKGEKKPALSLAPCAKRLSALIKKPVKMAPDCVGQEVEALTKEMQPGELMLLENLRFHPGEEHPEREPHFANELAKLGDIYINDAFGAAHRAHSSVTEVAKYFEGKRAAGLLLEKEISFLGSAFKEPKRPFYAIIGGAKVSSKLGVLQSLLNKVDALFIGGGMAYTFLKAQGIEIGDSLFEPDLLGHAEKFLREGQEKGIPLYLPQDLVIAQDFSPDVPAKTVPARSGIPEGWQGMDLGPSTQAIWKEELKKAAMVFWNGPLGVFEFPRFAKGTDTIARTLANIDALTIVGGGDSLAAVTQTGLENQFTHLSTGGGATLEYIEYGQLPGIEVLKTI